MYLELVWFELSHRGSDMAAEDKAAMDWSSEPALSPTSPSHLTHFKPLTPEQDEPPLRSAYSSFVSLFRFNKGETDLFLAIMPYSTSAPAFIFFFKSYKSFNCFQSFTVCFLSSNTDLWQDFEWEMSIVNHHLIWKLQTRWFWECWLHLTTINSSHVQKS